MLTELERSIIDISYEQKRSHIGSCLTTVGSIDAIYSVKKPEEPFILGNSHAALALFVVLEKYGYGNAREMADKYGTHAYRDMDSGVWVSGGSLGQAETLAVGFALSDRTRNTYLLTSDGACAEGSIWEALRIAGEQRLENFRVTVIANGYSGIGEVDTNWLDNRLNTFYPTLVVRANAFKYPDWLQGVAGHYAVMNKEMYEEILKT